jgi:hypothetical protein
MWTAFSGTCYHHDSSTHLKPQAKWQWTEPSETMSQNKIFLLRSYLRYYVTVLQSWLTQMVFSFCAFGEMCFIFFPKYVISCEHFLFASFCAHQEMLLKPSKGSTPALQAGDLPFSLALPSTAVWPQHTGVFAGLRFVIYRWEGAEEESLGFTSVLHIGDCPEPHEMLTRLLRANFSVSTALLPPRIKNRATWIAELDIPGCPAGQWRIPEPWEIQLTFPREISGAFQVQDSQTHFHNTLECSQSHKR